MKTRNVVRCGHVVKKTYFLGEAIFLDTQTLGGSISLELIRKSDINDFSEGFKWLTGI